MYDEGDPAGTDNVDCNLFENIETVQGKRGSTSTQKGGGCVKRGFPRAWQV